MAIIQIGRCDDAGLADVRFAVRQIKVRHVVGASPVKAGTASSPIIGGAAEGRMHEAPRDALVLAANAALAQQRMPVRPEIAQLNALVTRVDAAARDRVLELARQVGIAPIGALPREELPVIEPVADIHLRVSDAIRASAEAALWRVFG